MIFCTATRPQREVEAVCKLLGEAERQVAHVINGKKAPQFGVLVFLCVETS